MYVFLLQGVITFDFFFLLFFEDVIHLKEIQVAIYGLTEDQCQEQQKSLKMWKGKHQDQDEKVKVYKEVSHTGKWS